MRPPAAPLRFAHPFFTSTPHRARTPHPGTNAHRMRQWIADKLGPLPDPPAGPMTLASFIGQPGVDEITSIGTIRFHAVGDTSRPGGSQDQEEIALEMAGDYHPDGGAQNPAFFLHLGDVIYGQDKESQYRDQFYRPYMHDPGKIIAIAGNHDGETFQTSDPTPLQAFKDNFCANAAVVPPIADGARIFRETMTQPGVYWHLDAPLVDIIGLYSNIAEGPGHLEGANGDAAQKDWLAQTLGNIQQSRGAGPRKALIIAVHHPPFSEGGHSGSPAMLQDIDTACDKAGIMADAVLSGHAHNYQRHTRRLNFQGTPMEIPFLVAGCGGHNDLPVAEANGQVIGDHTYEKSLRGYGFLLVTVTPQRLTIDLWQAEVNATEPFDTVSVDLQTNRLV